MVDHPVGPGPRACGVSDSVADMTTPAPSPTADTVSLTLAELELLCRDAVRAAGGSAQTAVSLASATVAAERRGRSEVGAAHLFDYLDAMAHGRLDGSAIHGS